MMFPKQTSKTPYSPNSHFFVEHGKVALPNPDHAATDAFGPVEGSKETAYSTTSVLRLSQKTKVFAICEGDLIVQPQTDSPSKVNIILKPLASYAPFKIKYFIYRGIDKSDLIDESGKLLKPLEAENNPVFLENLWKQSTEGDEEQNPLAESIGYAPDNQPKDTLLSDCFYTQAAEPTTCRKGDHIGNATGEIGLDIVLDGGDYELEHEVQLFVFNLDYARKKGHVFDTNTITGAERQKRYKEYIHQFIDAAAFWGSHLHNGTVMLFEDGASKPQTEVQTLYSAIVSNYHTDTNVYLYIRSQRGRSYNYYTDSGKVSLDVEGEEPSLVDYQTHGWPILIKSILTDTKEVNSLQLSFGYVVENSLHPTDIYLSAFCVFPGSSQQDFKTTSELLKTTRPQSKKRPDLPVRSEQSKLITSIPTKNIEKATPSSQHWAISNILSMVVYENQAASFLQFYNDLWQANIKKMFSISPDGRENCCWSSQTDNKVVNLSAIGISDVAVNTRVITDFGEDENGAVEERKLYQALFSHISGESKPLQTERGLLSATCAISTEEDYGRYLFNNSNRRFYRGTLKDGGTVVNALHLADEEHYYHKRKTVQLGILTREYNQLVHKLKEVTTNSDSDPNDADDPANIYLHLEEAEKGQGASKGFRKFKLGLRYEGRGGVLATTFPQTDIPIYTLDNFTFFSPEFANYQKFYREQPKCNVAFKRHSNYAGEFGFDWMRDDYKNNVGKLYKNGSVVKKTNTYKGQGISFKPDQALYKKLELEYTPFPVQFNLEKDEHDVEQYCVPILTIYPPYDPTALPDLDKQPVFGDNPDTSVNRIALLQLNIDITSEPEKMEFDYDRTAISIDPISDTTALSIPKKFGRRALRIKVSCLRALHREELIQVKAYYKDRFGKIDPTGQTVGALRINPNSEIHRTAKRIVMIPVETNITGYDNTFEDDDLNELALSLKKFLRQVLTSPIIEVLKLDLKKNDTFKSSYVKYSGNPGIRSNAPSQSLQLQKELEEFLLDQNVPGTNTTIAKMFPDHCKMFYFKELIYILNASRKGYRPSINGYGNPILSVTVIDYSEDKGSTSAHEFLHTINLPHSFAAYEGDKNATFSFKPTTTDNLMDYSKKEIKQSLWNWQADIVRENLDKEPKNN